MANILSLCLYILTVLFGIYIDRKKKPESSLYKKIYIIWLFVFYCFGYMIGDDWRNYEVIYNDPTSYKMLRFLSEPLSLLTFTLFPKILPDFWLFLGIMKSLYLSSVILLCKKITAQWVTCVAIMTMGQLNFLLIDCPLRFMLALIFVNLALSQFLADEKMNAKSVITMLFFLLVALLFHNTCLFYLLTVPLLISSSKLYKVNRVLLFFCYLFLLLATSNVSLMNFLLNYFSEVMRSISLNASDEYAVSSNSSIFSIGNISQIVFFAIVLISRDKVCGNNERCKLVYCGTIVYFLLCRLFLIIPTGFRIPLPLSVFYVVYIIYLLNKKLLRGKIIVIYMLFAFVNNTWNNFNMLPYSNSIPYIISEHKPYSERYYYNFNAYKDRMGVNHPKYYEYQFDE